MAKYSLPKIWQCRVPKYWDKKLPKDYPSSDSAFALSYETEDERAAVEELEETYETEDSPISEIIPEDHFLSNYIGTYDVTYNSEEPIPEEGVYTLLSPQAVNTDEVIAVHYNTETSAWEQVEDAAVVDGYVWGTLTSFSPVAVFEVKRDIVKVTETDSIKGSNFIVCNGNAVLLTIDDNNKVVCVNRNSGTSIEVGTNCIVIGGTIDGTDVESTSVTAIGITDTTLNIIGGSSYWQMNEEAKPFAHVGKIDVFVKGSKIRGISGSEGMTRTEECNIKCEDSKITYFIGTSQPQSTKQNKSANPQFPTLASPSWTKVANVDMINSDCYLPYIGGNSGYSLTLKGNLNVKGGKHGYMLACASNGIIKDIVANIEDAEIDIFQTTNRGSVDSVTATIRNCKIDKLFVAGDSTDSTVNGTIASSAITINAGDDDSYAIYAGTNGGTYLTKETADEIVKYVKVSRNANVTISDADMAILKDKYILK